MYLHEKLHPNSTTYRSFCQLLDSQTANGKYKKIRFEVLPKIINKNKYFYCYLFIQDYY
jgi:hypothetical protein